MEERHNDDLEIVIAAAEAALAREDARAERLDAKARNQMTLAATWFAVVQAVAGVGLREGIGPWWLVAVGAVAASASIALVVTMRKSYQVWQLQPRPAIGSETLEAMADAATQDDTSSFRRNLVTQYQHLVGKAQQVNFDRAKKLDAAVRPWAFSLGLGLLEIAVALLARIVGA